MKDRSFNIKLPELSSVNGKALYGKVKRIKQGRYLVEIIHGVKKLDTVRLESDDYDLISDAVQQLLKEFLKELMENP